MLLIIEYASDDTRVIKTVWHRSYHDAGAYGSDLVSGILGQPRAFSFPKSYSPKMQLWQWCQRNTPLQLLRRQQF